MQGFHGDPMWFLKAERRVDWDKLILQKILSFLWQLKNLVLPREVS